MCIQFSNLQAVKRDWQSFNEQIYRGGGWGGFDAILQNQVFPDFTISEVGINIFGVHVMLWLSIVSVDHKLLTHLGS